jgi:PD-(D/E)XK nuclease superfamily
VGDRACAWWDTRLAYEADSRRTRSYRRLQSRWREVELGLPPGQYTDRNGRLRCLGSRLPDGTPLDRQLLSMEAVAHAQLRLPQLDAEHRHADAVRLATNMLSSQPLCFSIFGHLDAHRSAGARVLAAALERPIEKIVDLVIEHAPAAASWAIGGDHPDNTAFDAMLTLRSQGEALLIGVETKYTEPFSPRVYEKPSYTRVTGAADSWFLPGAAETACASATNQLWRNLMLAQESGRALGVEAGIVVLTAAHDNGAQRAVAGMRALLKEPYRRLSHVLLEDLMDAATTEPSLAVWAERLRRRYLDLSLAEPPS